MQYKCTGTQALPIATYILSASCYSYMCNDSRELFQTLFAQGAVSKCRACSQVSGMDAMTILR